MKNSYRIQKSAAISLMLLVMGLMNPLFAKSKASATEIQKTFKARITFYYPNEARSGFHSAKGDRLIPWKSAAVCFRTIPYGTKIKIPGIGTLIAQDTGSAVISRKAARQNGQNVPVIDVCVSSHADMMRMQRDFPMFVDVSIDRNS